MSFKSCKRPLTVFGLNFSVAVVVAVVCLTLSRHDSFFPIRTNVVMQGSKNTSNGRPCDQKLYDTKKYEWGGPTDDTPLTDRLKHNAFGGAFSEPLRKRSHPVCETNHPTPLTRRSKRLQISRPPTSVGPSPQQNSTWWRRVFLEDSSCPWATYS